MRLLIIFDTASLEVFVSKLEKQIKILSCFKQLQCNLEVISALILVYQCKFILYLLTWCHKENLK